MIISSITNKTVTGKGLKIYKFSKKGHFDPPNGPKSNISIIDPQKRL